jgi:hypothetical protein
MRTIDPMLSDETVRCVASKQNAKSRVHRSCALRSSKPVAGIERIRLMAKLLRGRFLVLLADVQLRGSILRASNQMEDL